MLATHRDHVPRRVVLAIGLCAAIAGASSTVALAQAPWRDGSADFGTQQLNDWRENNRRQQQRDDAITDQVRDRQTLERRWQANDRSATDGSTDLRLFPEPPSRLPPGQRR